MYSSVSILFIPSVALLTIQNHVTSNLWHLVRQVISSSGHWTHDCQLEMITSQLTCKMLGNIWWCFWLCWLRRGRYWQSGLEVPITAEPPKEWDPSPKRTIWPKTSVLSRLQNLRWSIGCLSETTKSSVPCELVEFSIDICT